MLAGIDLGGTTIKLALGNSDGDLRCEASIPTESHLGPKAVLTRIGDQLEQLSSDQSVNITAIGVGVPGLVDIDTGTTKFLPNLPTQWRDVSVGSIFSERFGCPVRVMNDVRTATLAELKLGHGRGRPNVSLAFFSIGTGIGGGVAIDGELRLGPFGSAGELGHQTILPDGPRCGCGNTGCLETLASGTAIAAEGVRLMRMGMAPTLHELVDGNADLVTTQQMAQAARVDEHIHAAILKAATYLGIAAANAVVVVHPDLVVLGGGVAEMGELLTNRVKELISKRVGMFPTEAIRVETSRLGEKAGVLGALTLAASTS